VQNRFDRFIPVAGMQLLESRPDWWKEILAFRFRDGSEKEQPLFLAARNGYLNAYVEGQSILKIAFDETVHPARLSGEVHHKYLHDGAEGQVYLKFDGHHYFDKSGTAVLGSGGTTLASRVERARKHTGAEKRGVAVIVGRHPQVIDVEMGLPANASVSPDVRPTAPRMDIVALEEDGNGAKIVFYEAKLFRNSELRADSLLPRVLTQLRRYVDWMDSPGRADEVVSAYRRACAIHVQIHAMRQPGSANPIHPLIQRAAIEGSLLTVDHNPRLVIFDYAAEARDASWRRHEDALSRAGIKLIMAPRPEDIVLPPLAASGVTTSPVVQV
jgi:hypothetical protein